jgi:hypothetical protein
MNKNGEKKERKAIYEKEICKNLASEFSLLCWITGRSSSSPFGKCFFDRGASSNRASDLSLC